MERLAEIDTVVFDKTGTLTIGAPRLANSTKIEPAALATAAAIAAHSRHPLSRALVEAAPARTLDTVPFNSVSEIPGQGLEAVRAGVVYRLGRADWALDAGAKEAPVGSTVLARNGTLLAAFEFEDSLRPGAAAAVAELKAAGLSVEIVSGDASATVASVADALSVERSHAQVPPGGKVNRLVELSRCGRKVLMVGDGLNDVPALAAAHVSMAPATAADIGRNAADFVFLHDSLSAVPLALEVSRRSGRLIRQNLVLAVGYNAVAVPIAILGHVTPLIAAVAMSTSSLIVIGNAMRLLRPRTVEVQAARRAGPSFQQPALAS